jgi:hypothetical protein
MCRREIRTLIRYLNACISLTGVELGSIVKFEIGAYRAAKILNGGHASVGWNTYYGLGSPNVFIIIHMAHILCVLYCTQAERELDARRTAAARCSPDIWWGAGGSTGESAAKTLKHLLQCIDIVCLYLLTLAQYECNSLSLCCTAYFQLVGTNSGQVDMLSGLSLAERRRFAEYHRVDASAASPG